MERSAINHTILNEQFEQALEDFTSGLSSLMYVLPNIIIPLANNGLKCVRKMADGTPLSKIMSLLKQGEIPREYEKRLEEISDTSIHTERTCRALEYSMRNHIVSSVSIFEVFMAKLVRLIYTTNPQYLDKKKALFSYNDIEKCDKDELREKFIDYGVATFMNLSKKEQFKKLGKLLNDRIYGDFYTPMFAEVCERRHIFVHSDGVITANYIKNCKDCNVMGIDSLKVGEKIKTAPSYITNCFFTIFTTGVIIGQLVWRKCTTPQNKYADESLVDMCVESINDKRPYVSLQLLLFAIDRLNKDICEENFPLFILNTALAYSLLGKVEKCVDLLNRVDWCKFAVRYQLAAQVLWGNFETAASMMKLADLSEVEYCKMPIFESFRQSDAFVLEFEKLFGKNPQDCTPQLLQPFEHLNTMLGIRQARQEMIEMQKIMSLLEKEYTES